MRIGCGHSDEDLLLNVGHSIARHVKRLDAFGELLDGTIDDCIFDNFLYRQRTHTPGLCAEFRTPARELRG